MGAVTEMGGHHTTRSLCPRGRAAMGRQTQTASAIQLCLCTCLPQQNKKGLCDFYCTSEAWAHLLSSSSYALEHSPPGTHLWWHKREQTSRERWSPGTAVPTWTTPEGLHLREKEKSVFYIVLYLSGLRWSSLAFPLSNTCTLPYWGYWLFGGDTN